MCAPRPKKLSSCNLLWSGHLSRWIARRKALVSLLLGPRENSVRALGVPYLDAFRRDGCLVCRFDDALTDAVKMPHDPKQLVDV
jgi:hypothetical protein